MAAVSNLSKRLKDVEDANGTLSIANAELKDRLDDLTSCQALSDLFQYLINLLSLFSHSSRISGASANSFSECFANTVSKISTDDNTNLSKEAAKIVSEFPSSSRVRNPKTTSNDDLLIQRWQYIVRSFRRFLQCDSYANAEIDLTDNDLIIFLIDLQMIKQQRNCLCHILPSWNKVHLAIPRIARSLERVHMSIEVIDIEHENYVRKPMALKIFRIIDEIFKELAESSGNAQSHNEVMNSIIEIMEKKSRDQSSLSSDDEKDILFRENI